MKTFFIKIVLTRINIAATRKRIPIIHCIVKYITGGNPKKIINMLKVREEAHAIVNRIPADKLKLPLCSLFLLPNLINAIPRIIFTL